MSSSFGHPPCRVDQNSTRLKQVGVFLAIFVFPTSAEQEACIPNNALKLPL